MDCRVGCAACCIAPSISTPLPNMPHGKPAGVICLNLDRETFKCTIWDKKNYPNTCRNFQAEAEVCGNDREEALQRIRWLEQETE